MKLVKLFEAKKLIEHGHAAKTVAADLGYKHLTHFCRDFKSVHGHTPRQTVVT